MTAVEWKRAVLPVLGDEAGWGFRGKLAYRRPVGSVLLGILGEGSGLHRDGVYIWAVVMPLFIEAESLVLTWSERMVPAGTFSLSDEAALRAAVAQAVAFLPSEAEALQALAARPSEATPGARVLLAEDGRTADERSRLRAVRDMTAASLRVA
jgi:hypothetical protein